METVAVTKRTVTYRCRPLRGADSCGTEVPVAKVKCPGCGQLQMRPTAPPCLGEPRKGVILTDAATGAPVALQTQIEAPCAGFVASMAQSFAMRNTKGRPRLSGLGDRQAMFGTLAPQPLRQRYGCKRSRVAMETDPDQWNRVALEAHRLLEVALPDRAAANVAAAADVADCWKFPDTGWTSGVLNLTQVLPYHRDAGNLADSWSAMIGARSSVEGGHLYLPEYDEWLDVGHGSLVCFAGADVVHGVTPIDVKRGGWRVTAVFYGLRGCIPCLDSHAAEMERASLRSTVRARAISDGDAPILTARKDKPPRPAPAPAPTFTEAEHRANLVEWARIMQDSGDLEPWAETMRWLVADGRLGDEEALWLVKLYNAYDSLASAWSVYERWPGPSEWLVAFDRDEAAKYECTQERRNLRGGKVLHHLAAYAEAVTSTETGLQREWLEQGLRTGRPRADWQVMSHHVRNLWGVGRQTAFEWCEFLAKVNGFPIDAPNADLWESEGPRRSLQRLYGLGTNPTLDQLNTAATLCKGHMLRGGVDLPWVDFETVICDFNVGRDGRYYPGRHLAALREEINGMSGEGRKLFDRAWWSTIPEPWCGIAPGINKELLPVYRDTGRIINSPEA